MKRYGFSTLRLLFGALGFGLLVLAGAWGYYRWANVVPPFQPPAVTLPQPNGFDALRAAVSHLKPVMTTINGQQREALDLSAPLPEMRRALRENQAALAEARAAMRLPYMEPPQYSFRAVYPYYPKFRSLARGFAVQSRLACED